MKKITGSLLALAAVLSFTAVGCGGNGKSKAEKALKAMIEENPEYASVEIQVNPETGKVWDLKGTKVIIGDWWTNADAAPSSKAQEDQLAFRQFENEVYNVNTTQMAISGWGDNPQFVSNFCITGGDENYCFIVDGRTAPAGMKANLFYDLSKIKSVNYKDASKYDQGVVEKLKKGDSFYAFNWGKPEPKHGLFFNKRILEENGFDPDLPYDLQKEGKWTWATFEDMLKKLTKDTDNDGVIDQYGMSSFREEFTHIALATNGGSFIGRDANGKYFNNTNSEKSMEALNWCQHMFVNYQLPQPEGSNWDYFRTAFINGETAFYADEEYNAQVGGNLSGMVDDFGFVCFPLGPSGDGKYKTLHNSNMCIIPAIYSAERAEIVAKAVDLWIETVPGYDDPDSWKEGFYAGFRDARAVDETLELMAATPNPRFDSNIAGMDGTRLGDILWSLTWVAPQELYENCKNVWQVLIDDANN